MPWPPRQSDSWKWPFGFHLILLLQVTYIKWISNGELGDPGSPFSTLMPFLSPIRPFLRVGSASGLSEDPSVDRLMLSSGGCPLPGRFWARKRGSSSPQGFINVEYNRSVLPSTSWAIWRSSPSIGWALDQCWGFRTRPVCRRSEFTQQGVDGWTHWNLHFYWRIC